MTLPAWYRELPDSDRDAGSVTELTQHTVFYCYRDPRQLIVSFGDLKLSSHSEKDTAAWIDRFARTKVYSHLAVQSHGNAGFTADDLTTHLNRLKDQGFFDCFQSIAFVGMSQGAGTQAVLDVCRLFPAATAIVFNPRSLPDTTVNQTYALFDPFEPETDRPVRRYSSKITTLHGMGMGDEIFIALKRMTLLETVFDAMVRGTLTEAEFYRLIRVRKEYYIYRRVIERQLEARGKTVLKDRFTEAFRAGSRQRKKLQAAEDANARDAAKALAAFTDTRPRDHVVPTLGDWPRTKGNVWQLIQDDDCLRYLSDQYQGQIMGFEQRGRTTLAQTPPLALGMAAFGDGAFVPRPLPELFNWHVVNEQLSGHNLPCAATSQAVTKQIMCRVDQTAFPTVIALSEPQSAITRTEALPGAPHYQSLMTRVRTAADALAPWGKMLHVDRFSLRLLTGEPDVSARDATEHYGKVIAAMSKDIMTASGQGTSPYAVVVQSAGSNTNGTSELALAEGTLDQAHAALKVVVATPTYPFDLMSDMPSTHTGAAQLMIDELSCLAVDAVQNGKPWYCPSMLQARADRTQITADFTALGDLVLDKGAHGFAITGTRNAPQITNVQVDGTQVILTLDQSIMPQTEAHLTYAWGATSGSRGTGRFANQGALRDGFSQPSLMNKGQTLHRHALSGRVRITGLS